MLLKLDLDAVNSVLLNRVHVLFLSGQYNTQSKISLELLEQCSLTFAPEMYITKNKTKWHLSYHCHDNIYATGPVLIKTKIPRFYLKQGSLTPNNLIGRAMYVLSKTPLPHLQSGIFGFSQWKTGAKSVAMATT